MTRILLLLILAVPLLVVGCAQPGPPGPAAQPVTARLPGLALEPAGRLEPTEAAREPLSARGASPAAPPAYSAAWLAATALPAPLPAAGATEATGPAGAHPTPPAPATPTAEPSPTSPAVRSVRPPHGFRADEPAPTPTPRPTPAPDRPFGFVARYKAESEVLLERVPALPQLRRLSCEAAAMRMVLSARGVQASEEEVLARMGHSDDPHQGFRGNVDGDAHDPRLKDYGVYAEVVERVLRSYEVGATAVRGMTDSELRETVRAGQAVIVWVTGEDDPLIIEQDGYRLVEEEHVYVVVGVLEDGRVLVHDPWGVRGDSGRTGTFPVWTIKQWDLFDRMAVIVPLS